MKIKNIVISLILLLLSATPLVAYYDLGTPDGYVNDYTNTLTQEQASALESKIAAFEQESTNEIGVVIIDSLQGDYIEHFAVKLFEEWGIGKERKDNGVLILVAMSDRQMRIEVGYGLEGSLTDVEANWIVQNVMVPNFKENRYYEGIDQSVDKIIEITKGEFEVPEDESTNSSISLLSIVLLIILIVIIVKILNRRNPSCKRRCVGTGSRSTSLFSGWGGGDSSSDSSGGGFGGGSSGGGGASGSW
ncbi:MAG TPA: TPM domain-containing protein [Candidatus Dojkabacteria bacterium]|nr:TPM domain-containing protein [Candidatus Dojkabacteria bacterium]